MSEYIVSARKYRPDTFASVVGQSSLTTTLSNAILTDRVAQAYLFCGPRGVGKTTCARIFAKTINCQNRTPEGEACNQCESCKAFNDGRSLNIYELDAASNNGVEHIRALVDQVYIPPQIGKYKVFIIDEVHMLSTAAFNAFLKTLEEPPAHVFFVLATTEKHKIIPTILSRCQIFDFNSMSVNDIASHLAFVAEQEGIAAEPEALNIIAQQADGGMRDALTLFDQAASYEGGKSITYSKAIVNLNVLDYEYFFRLTDYFLACNIPGILLVFDEILRKGFNAPHFITGLSSHLRDLLVSKDEPTLQLLDVVPSVKDRYRAQSAQCSVKFLTDAMKICNYTDVNFRVSSNKRFHVELMLIRIAQLSQADTTTAPSQVVTPIQKISTAPVAPTANPAPTPTVTPAAPPTVNTTATTTVTAHKTVEAASSSEQSSPLQLGFSMTETAPTTDAVPEQSASATQATPLTNKLTAQDLAIQWSSLILSLPDEHKDKLPVLKGLTPKLTDEDTGTFELRVSSEINQDTLQSVVDYAEHFISEKTQAPVKMSIILVKEDIPTVAAMTEQERYNEMRKHSPALRQLNDEIGLELS